MAETVKNIVFVYITMGLVLVAMLGVFFLPELFRGKEDENKRQNELRIQSFEEVPEAVVSQFKKKHPEISVVVNKIPVKDENWEVSRFMESVLPKVETAQDEFDIFQYPTLAGREMLERGLYEDLAGYSSVEQLTAELRPALKEVAYQGQSIIGVPAEISLPLALSRDAAREIAEVDLDDFTTLPQLAPLMQRIREEIDTFRILLPEKYNFHLYFFRQYISTQSGSIITFRNESFRRGMEILAKMYDRNDFITEENKPPDNRTLFYIRDFPVYWEPVYTDSTVRPLPALEEGINPLVFHSLWWCVNSEAGNTDLAVEFLVDLAEFNRRDFPGSSFYQGNERSDWVANYIEFLSRAEPLYGRPYLESAFISGFSRYSQDKITLDEFITYLNETSWEQGH